MINGEINVACCGVGINSVAGIIEATNRGIIFDYILFANTGKGKKLGERKATYEYIDIFNKWLIDHGQPKLKMLHSRNKAGNIITLYDEVLKLDTLPSIVFGFKTCSQRFKIAPQDKFIDQQIIVKNFYQMGKKITKWIFYDADEPERAKEYISDKYQNRYFLIEIDFGRFECIKTILNAGLPLPPKSSCKFCASMKPYQIIEMYESCPADFYEAATLERNAIMGGRLINVKGLGRDWSWWDLIKAYRYLRIIKKHGSGKLNKKMKAMIKRISRSKPIILRPAEIRNKKPIDSIFELFTTHQDIPCGCYDG